MVFTQRLVGLGIRILRELIPATSLPEQKKHLNNALRHVLGFLGLSPAQPGIGSLLTQDIL